MLVVDRLINPPNAQIRHYQPATLGKDGRIEPGKAY